MCDICVYVCVSYKSTTGLFVGTTVARRANERHHARVLLHLCVCVYVCMCVCVCVSYKNTKRFVIGATAAEQLYNDTMRECCCTCERMCMCHLCVRVCVYVRAQQ